MDMTTSLLVVIGFAAILSACGVLFSRDNLYASVCMSITLILIAAAYAVFDIQPVFILITFIFVGAVGAVTVAIAATYRQQPKLSVDKVWIAPALITAASVGYAIYAYVNYGMEFSSNSEEMLMTFTSDYILLATFLISLSVLLMVAVVKFVRREGI